MINSPVKFHHRGKPSVPTLGLQRGSRTRRKRTNLKDLDSESYARDRIQANSGGAEEGSGQAEGGDRQVSVAASLTVSCFRTESGEKQ